MLGEGAKIQGLIHIVCIRGLGRRRCLQHEAGGGAGARAAATQLLGEDDEQGEALVGWACRGRLVSVAFFSLLSVLLFLTFVLFVLALVNSKKIGNQLWGVIWNISNPM